MLRFNQRAGEGAGSLSLSDGIDCSSDPVGANRVALRATQTGGVGVSCGGPIQRSRNELPRLFGEVLSMLMRGVARGDRRKSVSPRFADDRVTGPALQNGRVIDGPIRTR